MKDYEPLLGKAKQAATAVQTMGFEVEEEIGYRNSKIKHELENGLNIVEGLTFHSGRGNSVCW